MSNAAFKWWQIGQNVGRLGKMLADGTSHLLTSCLQIGQHVARWDHPTVCRWDISRWADVRRLDGTCTSLQALWRVELQQITINDWKSYGQYSQWYLTATMVLKLLPVKLPPVVTLTRRSRKSEVLSTTAAVRPDIRCVIFWTSSAMAITSATSLLSSKF